MKKTLVIAITICGILIGIGIFVHIEIKKNWTQKLEFNTKDALVHAYSDKTVQSWIEKLNISNSNEKIIFARSAHSMFMAGEEFIIAYPKDFLDLTKIHILETEKNYCINTIIPNMKLSGTRYGLTQKIGDGGFVEIIKTAKYDVIYIYAGDG